MPLQATGVDTTDGSVNLKVLGQRWMIWVDGYCYLEHACLLDGCCARLVSLPWTGDLHNINMSKMGDALKENTQREQSVSHQSATSYCKLESQPLGELSEEVVFVSTQLGLLNELMFTPVKGAVRSNTAGPLGHAVFCPQSGIAAPASSEEDARRNC